MWDREGQEDKQGEADLEPKGPASSGRMQWFPAKSQAPLASRKGVWSVSYVSRVCATGEQGPHTPTVRPWLKAASGYELTSTSCGQIAPVAQG